MTDLSETESAQLEALISSLLKVAIKLNFTFLEGLFSELENQNYFTNSKVSFPESIKSKILNQIAVQKPELFTPSYWQTILYTWNTNEVSLTINSFRVLVKTAPEKALEALPSLILFSQEFPHIPIAQLVVDLQFPDGITPKTDSQSGIKPTPLLPNLILTLNTELRLFLKQKFIQEGYDESTPVYKSLFDFAADNQDPHDRPTLPPEAPEDFDKYSRPTLPPASALESLADLHDKVQGSAQFDLTMVLSSLKAPAPLSTTSTEENYSNFENTSSTPTISPTPPRRHTFIPKTFFPFLKESESPITNFKVDQFPKRKKAV